MLAGEGQEQLHYGLCVLQVWISCGVALLCDLLRHLHVVA